ncbi:MAG TPA: FecR domain-containing protein [Ohtaekwangia sp.]|nr:FecR domain-containing protein [Ohtaekwangia sp.]
MDGARFKVLFQRYIDNSCTEAEKAEFWQMVESFQHDDSLAAMMDSLWQSTTLDKRLPREKADEILNEILSGAPVIPMRNTGRKDVRRWYAAAAVTAILSASIFGLYQLNSRDVQPQVATAVNARVAVPDNEHRLIQLPDGSTVILNAGSTLDYPPSFNDQSTREVKLVGEGYFDIRHDPAKPFIVHTGTLRTTVLGTAFNIRAYAADNDITVTVTRGKVRVSDEEKEIGILTPDQQITFNGKNKKSEQQQVNSKSAVAWAENDIFFNEITVGEAVKRLEERFGVSILFENTGLRECRFTATFVHNEDLNQILEVICEFNNASFTRRDGAIVIKGEGC